MIAFLPTGYFYGLIQGEFLFRSKSAGLALCELAKCEWTDRNADKPENFDSQMFKHASDLAVLAFVKHDFQPRIFLTAAQDVRALGSPDFAAELLAAKQRVN